VNKHSNILKDALKILSISEVSESKLRFSLQKKGYGENEISEVLCYLRKRNLINNSRLCTILTEKHIRRKKGINYIREILSLHGIPEDIISSTLAKIYPESLEYKLAKDIVESLKKPLSEAILKLKSRGFSERTIEKLTEEKSGQQGDS